MGGAPPRSRRSWRSRAQTCIVAAAMAACSPDEGSEAGPGPPCSPERAEFPSTFEGIYELTSYTHNGTACDTEGPPADGAALYSHVYVRTNRLCDDRYLVAILCEDLESCRARAPQVGDIPDFVFGEGDDDEGWWELSMPLSIGETSCQGIAQRYTLTGEAGVDVHIAVEMRTITDVPVDEEDFCDWEAASAQEAAAPCEQLTVIKGAYLEPIFYD